MPVAVGKYPQNRDEGPTQRGTDTLEKVEVQLRCQISRLLFLNVLKSFQVRKTGQQQTMAYSILDYVLSDELRGKEATHYPTHGEKQHTLPRVK